MSSGFEWEEAGKKSKNKNKANASRQWTNLQSTPKAWGQSDPRRNAVRGFNNPQMRPDSVSVPPVIPPPLKNGWGWNNRPGVSQAPKADVVEDDVEEDSDGIEDSDDDLMSDDFDSDEGPKSHEQRKNNKWFKDLFQSLDSLTVEQVNEPERQWHCPACKGGPGAIDWYSGLQPLLAHARTKKSKRMKLHRELYEVLEEELRLRGMSAVPAGETYGKWQGVRERPDKQIVWPPMVIIMNTKLEKDDNEKWKGMGNQELLDYFSDYNPMRAKHSYGPQGHRGISVLIFEASAVGYAEAERLSTSFEETSKGRAAWERNRALFYSGGQRQLYGFLAEKHDLENFNQHCQGKSKLKYDMSSYHEMVVKQMKQMSEENQQLMYYKEKAAKEKMNCTALAQTMDEFGRKLQKTSIDHRALKQATQKHNQTIQEEMDSQEQFYKERIQQLLDNRDMKQEKFVEENAIKAEAVESAHQRRNDIENLDEFTRKKEPLVKMRDEKMDALAKKKKELMKQLYEEQMAIEKEFDEKVNLLMEEHASSKSK